MILVKKKKEKVIIFFVTNFLYQKKSKNEKKKVKCDIEEKIQETHTEKSLLGVRCEEKEGEIESVVDLSHREKEKKDFFRTLLQNQQS